MGKARPELECDGRKGFKDVFRSWIRNSEETHKTIADEIGVSPATLSAWINGHRFPNVDNLQAISDYTGIPLCRILCEKTDCEECRDHPKHF